MATSATVNFPGMTFDDMLKVMGISKVEDLPPAPEEQLKADAAAKGVQTKAERRRRIKRNSLLATGGAGDLSLFETSQPFAFPGTKPNLGG
jgi:hypothetical protein